MLVGWARALLELDEAALVRIAFRDEPLRGKLTEAMKQSLYEGARAEGEARLFIVSDADVLRRLGVLTEEIRSAP